MPVSCPHCQSKAIRRSMRKGMLESTILRLIPVRPFRCKDCDHRFYSRTSQTNTLHSKSMAAR